MNTQTLTSNLTSEQVPHGIRLAAFAIPLTIVPSVFWRLAATFSVPGFGSEGRQDNVSGDVIYIQFLNVFSLSLGLLALGFVMPWGRALPGWIPLVGGWAVPPLLPVIPAVVAGVLWFCSIIMVFILGISLFSEVSNAQEAQDFITTLQTETTLALFYFPMVATGPLTVVVALSYYFRRPGKLRNR